MGEGPRTGLGALRSLVTEVENLVHTGDPRPALTTQDEDREVWGMGSYDTGESLKEPTRTERSVIISLDEDRGVGDW